MRLRRVAVWLAAVFTCVTLPASPAHSQDSCEVSELLALDAAPGDLFGIINGVDYREWNPETDALLSGNNYGLKNFAEGKRACIERALAPARRKQHTGKKPKN